MDHTPEFSHIIQVSELGTNPMEINVVASPQELTALKDRLNIERIREFKGHVILQKLENSDVTLKADFNANVQQHCVVTLEKITTKVKGSFSLVFSPEFVDEDDEEPEADEEFKDENELVDAPEPLLNGEIDVGEVLCQHLVLEIDPFPRVKGAQFDGYTAEPKNGEKGAFEKKNPFQVLEKLKTK